MRARRATSAWTRMAVAAFLGLAAGFLAALPPAGCKEDPECSADADCDDGVWCDGAETCGRNGTCYQPAIGPCEDGLACNTDTCDETARTCAHQPRDVDGDTYADAACGGDDCNDALAGVHPGVTETCNGIDDDCDGSINEDRDHDGHRDPAVCPGEGDDCDDGNPHRYPGAPEICDGVDNDCDGVTTDEPDTDGDTYVDETCTSGNDCDDDDANVHPGVHEACNGEDDDCNEATDEDFSCARGAHDVACVASCGSSGTGTCTDACTLATGPACHPPEEICNHADDDCDGRTDEDCPVTDGGCLPGDVECCGDGSDDDCDTTIDETDCRPHGGCPAGTQRHCFSGDEWGWGVQICPAGGAGWGGCTDDVPPPGCPISASPGWDANCCRYSGACCQDTADADGDGSVTDSVGAGCGPEPACP